MPNATGVAMASARIDEYSVPQMNGSAPKSPSDRVPRVGDPELEPELADRQERLSPEDEADCADDENDAERRRTRCSRGTPGLAAPRRPRDHTLTAP